MGKEFLWWRDGVIYQIYPRSFADSNGDGIGDLTGITNKLRYLSDLGIDAIWLSAINPSPDADFGYDVSDYYGIDPKFGTLSDFDSLLDKAHKLEIRVILDLVLNHTSNQHPWFIESKKSRENPKRDWYIWRDGRDGHKPPNNWQSVFGGNAWQYDGISGQYYYHMFYKQQPDLNWRNPAVREEMMNIFRFWSERGVDGFRLDVFNEYFKDAEFRDNPYKVGIRPFDQQKHIFDANQPEMMGVVQDIREVLDNYPERYAVGETFLASLKDAAAYTGPDKLHAAFDLSFLKNKWKPNKFLKSVIMWEKELSTDSWPNYVLNNHDTKRSATRFRVHKNDQQLKVAAAMLLTLRGTPFLYYGEEIGMRDIRLSRAEIQDPIGLHYWPVPIGRDGCRSPMQWDASSNSGFSSTKPWLKVHPNYIKRNVQVQSATPNSLFNFYKALLKLRKQFPVFQGGMFIPLNFEPQRVMAYIRKDAAQTILVALNFSRRPSKLAVGGEITRFGWDLLFSNQERKPPLFKKGWLKLKGFEACILIQKEKMW